jgi:hypothetical protein
MSGRLRLRALAALAACAAATLFLAHPAMASESDEAYFVQAINNVRAARGLPALAVDGQLTAVARTWSTHMDADGTLSHNPSLSGQVSGWRTLGENVGTGSTLDSIENAFENSPHHFENMVDPSYRLIGVGVVHDSDGTYWVTEDFKQPSGSAAPAAAPAPRPAAPKPAPAPRPAPRPAPAPVAHAAAPVHAAAAPVATTPPVPTTAAMAAPSPTVPIAVLGTSTHRAPALSTADGDTTSPLSAARRAALVAFVLLGAVMAVMSRARRTVFAV